MPSRKRKAPKPLRKSAVSKARKRVKARTAKLRRAEREFLESFGRGRPSDYQPEFAEDARKLCELGATDLDLADFFGCSINTIGNWKTRYPEFLGSLKAGKDSADDRVERSLYQRAVGYTFDSCKIFFDKESLTEVVVPFREHVPPDVVAAIFWLKNRRRDIWRDRQELEHTGRNGAAIQTEDVTPRDETDIARRMLFVIAQATRAGKLKAEVDAPAPKKRAKEKS